MYFYCLYFYYNISTSIIHINTLDFDHLYNKCQPCTLIGETSGLLTNMKNLEMDSHKSDEK